MQGREVLRRRGQPFFSNKCAYDQSSTYGEDIVSLLSLVGIELPSESHRVKQIVMLIDRAIDADQQEFVSGYRDWCLIFGNNLFNMHHAALTFVSGLDIGQTGISIDQGCLDFSRGFFGQTVPVNYMLHIKPSIFDLPDGFQFEVVNFAYVRQGQFSGGMIEHAIPLSTSNIKS